ncbi:MAG TPA: calcium-binding protein [Nitrososphaeraceae archaeon]|nr:calcium-binding protein [Nitrososphaeraceae archaeon]
MTIVDHKNSNDNKHNHHYENLSTLGKILLFVGLLISFLSFSYFTFNNHFLLSVQAKSDNDCSSKDSNIIVGTRPITLGTKCNDVIIACPVIVSGSGLGSTCQNGDIVRGFEKNDVIQGSVGNDELYGDEGNDKILGSDGSDKLYGGPDSDILQGGQGADLLLGGNGDDELYGGAGDDVSIGGKGINFFDCGDGNDIIVDFDPDKGDTQSGNCEVVLNNHGDMNIFTQPNKIKSQLEAFGIGSSKDEIDINDLGKTIDD